MERLFDGHRPRLGQHLDDHQLGRPGGHGHVHRRGRPHRRGPPGPVGDHPERHLEGVPGPEGVRLPAAARASASSPTWSASPRPSSPAGTRCRSRATTSARRGRRPPRSWPSPWPTGSPTSRRRWPPAWRSTIRPPAQLLLQRPHRLLRGDRQVPRRPAHLGALAARPLRRRRRPLHPAAVPHPDRRGLAHRPAARGEPGPGGHRGPGRRAGGHPEPAHRLLRRGAGPADRAGGPPGAAHPAGDRRGDRRGPRGRPPGRLVVGRVAHRRARAPGRGDLRPPRGGRFGVDARGGARLHRGRLVLLARSPTPPTASSPTSPPAGGSRSG